MSYDTQESSVQGSIPQELYVLQVGSSATYRWTSAAKNITIGSDTYQSIPIERGSIAMGDDERRRVLTISIDSQNPVARLYTSGAPPGELTSVTIFRLQALDGTQTPQLIYKGSVISAQFSENSEIAQLAIQSAENVASHEIPRVHYRGMCNHILFDDGCGVLPAPFTYTGTVTAVSGKVITVSGASGFAHTFDGGYAKPVAVSDFRTVRVQSGDDLTLTLPFFISPLGQTIQVFAGCDHLLEGHCSQRFANEDRFGGFPFIPLKNPAAEGLV